MKAIKISEEKSVAIALALDAVNGKAWNHTFSTFREIADIAADAEKQVVEIVGSQRAAVGAVLKAVSGQKVANSYKYARIGTRVVIERRSTGWFLINIVSETLYASQGGARTLTLTPAQDAKAIEVLRASYLIAPVEVTPAG
jgi:hypothetical protein